MNPYNSTEAVNHPKDLFGREKELVRIKSNLDNSIGRSSNHIAFIGEPTMGKSSFLNVTSSIIENDYKMIIPVKIEFTGKEGISLINASFRIIKNLIKKMKNIAEGEETRDVWDSIGSEIENISLGYADVGDLAKTPYMIPKLYKKIIHDQIGSREEIYQLIPQALCDDLLMIYDQNTNTKFSKIALLIDDLQGLFGAEVVWDKVYEINLFLNSIKTLATSHGDKFIFIITTYPVLLDSLNFQFTRYFPSNGRINVTNKFQARDINDFVTKPLKELPKNDIWVNRFQRANPETIDVLREKDAFVNQIQDITDGAQEIKLALQKCYDLFKHEIDECNNIIDFNNDKAWLEICETISDVDPESKKEAINRIKDYDSHEKYLLLSSISVSTSKKYIPYFSIFDSCSNREGVLYIHKNLTKSIDKISFEKTIQKFINDDLFTYDEKSDELTWNHNIYHKKYLRWYLREGSTYNLPPVRKSSFPLLALRTMGSPIRKLWIDDFTQFDPEKENSIKEFIKSWNTDKPHKIDNWYQAYILCAVANLRDFVDDYFEPCVLNLYKYNFHGEMGYLIHITEKSRDALYPDPGLWSMLNKVFSNMGFEEIFVDFQVSVEFTEGLLMKEIRINNLSLKKLSKMFDRELPVSINYYKYYFDQNKVKKNSMLPVNSAELSIDLEEDRGTGLNELGQHYSDLFHMAVEATNNQRILSRLYKKLQKYDDNDINTFLEKRSIHKYNFILLQTIISDNSSFISDSSKMLKLVGDSEDNYILNILVCNNDKYITKPIKSINLYLGILLSTLSTAVFEGDEELEKKIRKKIINYKSSIDIGKGIIKLCKQYKYLELPKNLKKTPQKELKEYVPN